MRTSGRIALGWLALMLAFALGGSMGTHHPMKVPLDWWGVVWLTSAMVVALLYALLDIKREGTP